MWRDSGTVGARMSLKVLLSFFASAVSAADAAGAMASKMPSNAWLKPSPSPSINSA